MAAPRPTPLRRALAAAARTSSAARVSMAAPRPTPLRRVATEWPALRQLVFQWPLRGPHHCDVGSRARHTRSDRAFQWPLRGPHLRDCGSVWSGSNADAVSMAVHGRHLCDPSVRGQHPLSSPSMAAPRPTSWTGWRLSSAARGVRRFDGGSAPAPMRRVPARFLIVKGHRPPAPHLSALLPDADRLATAYRQPGADPTHTLSSGSTEMHVRTRGSTSHDALGPTFDPYRAPATAPLPGRHHRTPDPRRQLRRPARLLNQYRQRGVHPTHFRRRHPDPRPAAPKRPR